MKSEAVVIRRTGARRRRPARCSSSCAASRASWWPGRYVMMDYDCRVEQLEKAVALTPGLESPTVSPLHNEGWVAVRAMVPAKEAQRIMDDLYDLGARAILTTGHPRLPPLTGPRPTRHVRRPARPRPPGHLPADPHPGRPATVGVAIFAVITAIALLLETAQPGRAAQLRLHGRSCSPACWSCSPAQGRRRRGRRHRRQPHRPGAVWTGRRSCG